MNEQKHCFPESAKVGLLLILYMKGCLFIDYCIYGRLLLPKLKFTYNLLLYADWTKNRDENINFKA